jgi:putative DNA methylase
MADDRRLIEEWLPIAAIGEESVRERRSMTALPPIYYLHVWWARRPLVASRAAILASLLPCNADPERFLSILGIHGDPVETRRRIDRAKKTGEDLGTDPYGYERAFKYSPTRQEIQWLNSELKDRPAAVLDPTAGGGSIPFEATRLGQSTFANDLNPVATLLLKATFEYPAKFGSDVVRAFKTLGREFRRKAEEKLQGILPQEPDGTQVLGYLWARSIRCPYCDGLVPLSPAWRLAPNGIGVRLVPHCTKEPVGVDPKIETGE